MEGSSQSRVEVDVYELKNDSLYATTDTSESLMNDPFHKLVPTTTHFLC